MPKRSIICCKWWTKFSALYEYYFKDPDKLLKLNARDHALSEGVL